MTPRIAWSCHNFPSSPSPLRVSGKLGLMFRGEGLLMFYKYLSLGSSDALSKHEGREGACMVHLPLEKARLLPRMGGSVFT